MNNIRKAIGSTMMSYRKQRGYTRTYIAQQLDVSDVAVYYWETGRNPITVEDLQRYCNIINVDWIKLLKESQS